MTSSSLIVPLILWGPRPPTHCISSLYLLRDQRTLLSGASDGQVIIWDIDLNTWTMTPRLLLVGHTSPVRCIAKASGGPDCHHIVTSGENGEMFTWDTIDGKCLESKKLNFIHTSIQPYRSPDSHAVKLYCSGFYEEILVMDPFTLTILFQLSSRNNPDWISAFHVLRPRNRSDDVVLALTTTGTVKVWTLNGDEHLHPTEPILENESKQIRCFNAVSLTCCVYNMRTVLIVCPTYWNIYDAGDFTCLLSVDCKRGERWIGGEFISAERICVWSDGGHAYLYKLPTNCIVESKDFHNKSKVTSDTGRSLMFCQFDLPSAGCNILECPPVFKYLIFSKDGKWMKYLVRGDAEGRLVVWKIPDTPECAMMQLKRSECGGNGDITVHPVQSQVSIKDVWATLFPHPPGILNQLEEEPVSSSHTAVTATVFLPMQCRLVCGRDDGSIIMVPATQSVMLHLLAGRHQKFTNWPQHQLLLGHSGRVNCLLYPNNEHPRYDVAHLVSGSVDFSVCLWDIYTGTLLHRFSAQAGEVVSLYVPPPTCSPRIQLCVCSVASDHSVTLLSLRERRCVMLASRHLFPVTTIKWRPLDDFLIVGCSDGTTYIWQMETGHLDRVVHGQTAEEILSACDENTVTVSVGDNIGSNPALHFFRGLRHRNLAAMKLAATTGINQLHGKEGVVDQIQEKSRAFPLVINGFKANPKDAEGHILFFDVEALITQLLTEEYSQMSPGTLEVQGFTTQREYERVWALTKPASPDTAKKIAGFLSMVKDKADERINTISSTASPETQRRLTGLVAKVKEGAEKAKGEIENAKREIEKRAAALDGTNDRKGSLGLNSVRPPSLHLEINLTLEIGQLLLSLLHAWGLDTDLDKVATSKLGLLKPKVPVSYGILSRGGSIMSLMLPTWKPDPVASLTAPAGTPKEVVDTYYFTARGHWELSHTITTNHLLSVIAITNTLVSVSNASFIPEQEKKRKLVRQATHGAMELPDKKDSSAFSLQQEQIKQGWSLLSTLHCLLLSGKLNTMGSQTFKKPLVEALAMRWQDRCLQIRLAAQELLVAELKNLGPKGRKNLVDVWGAYLPKYGDPPFHATNGGNAVQVTNADSGEEEEMEVDEDELEEGEECNTGAIEMRRNQTTSVILLGVIGALFDLEAERKGGEGGVDAVALGPHLTRLTAKALMYLILSATSSFHSTVPAPASVGAAGQPAHSNNTVVTVATSQPTTMKKSSASTALRRAAIDLIGRGFILWEPHLEVSKVLLGLLEMSSEADWWVPSPKYGLPLTAGGDACRTSRHALVQIARVRPAVFVTSIAREIARYNNLVANAQTLNLNLTRHVLVRAKAEILHLVELLIESNRAELAELLVDVVDIVLHCIDSNHLKSKSLSEIFPPVCLFPQISHCTQTRRIAVGTRAGTLAMYDLRACKVQIINAHSGQVIAVAFTSDGKYLATYSPSDNKLHFWQTSTGMFGLGNAQTKCTRSYNVPPMAQSVHWSVMYTPKLVWTHTNRTVTLLLPDGTEQRFNC